MGKNKFSESGFASLLLEAMAEGVFTLDEAGRITNWNASMERITGYSSSEAIGNNCSLLNFSRCYGKSCPTGFAECGIFKHGKVRSKECYLRHRDGHDVPVLKNARLVKDETGEVIGVVETVTDLTELYRMRNKVEEADRKLGELLSFDNIIGKSREMQDVFASIRAASASDATILIQGESGTGKELVAGAIHHSSNRSEMPLVTVNCSALSESLLESELFGHIKGSFTGAVRDRAGRFEEAEGGTVFLDEIGEITPFMQVKLLRVLQEREIERVGESRRRSIDIRVITATNKDLYTLVREGKFREDLYYRLKVFPIHIPPLHHRKEDIPYLVERFIDLQNRRTGKSVTGVSRDGMQILMDYHWPGNVRELENAVEHAFVLCTGDMISSADLPVEIRGITGSGHLQRPFSTQHRRGVSKSLTRESLVELLDTCGWNKAEAGRRLGVSRTAVWKYMKKWDIPLTPE